MLHRQRIMRLFRNEAQRSIHDPSRVRGSLALHVSTRWLSTKDAPKHREILGGRVNATVYPLSECPDVARTVRDFAKLMHTSLLGLQRTSDNLKFQADDVAQCMFPVPELGMLAGAYWMFFEVGQTELEDFHYHPSSERYRQAGNRHVMLWTNFPMDVIAADTFHEETGVFGREERIHVPKHCYAVVQIKADTIHAFRPAMPLGEYDGPIATALSFHAEENLHTLGIDDLLTAKTGSSPTAFADEDNDAPVAQRQSLRRLRNMHCMAADTKFVISPNSSESQI